VPYILIVGFSLRLWVYEMKTVTGRRKPLRAALETPLSKKGGTRLREMFIEKRIPVR
jgi:hypothetical protein